MRFSVYLWREKVLVMNNIYIDEAGNTGADILIKDQPVFVLAGVMLNGNQEKVVLQKMDEQFNLYKEKEECEIKGSSWSKTARKAFALQAIIEEVLAQNGNIAVVIVEKRFMAGAMVIDNFFDYVYNDIKDVKWVNDRTIKVQGANYYYDRISDELASKIWNLFRTPQSSDCFLQIVDELISITDNREYCSLLQGSKPHIEELIKDLYNNTALNQVSTKCMRAPNFSAFNQLINMLIPICYEDNTETKLIIDEQRQFEKSYKSLFDIFSNIEKPFISTGLEQNDVIYSWRGIVTDMSMANSKINKGLQLADIVASSINNLMLKSQKYNTSKFLPLDLFNIGLLHVLDSNCKTVHYVVSKQFFKKYLDAVKYLSTRIDEIKGYNRN